MNARQTYATPKCTLPDTRHAVRNCHACQAAATLKRILADARHAVRNRHACQAAPTKRILTDARYAVRNRDARQVFTARKRIGADARYAVRDHISHFWFACRIRQQGSLSLIKQYAVFRGIGRVILRHADFRQAAAAGEGSLPDTRHAVRDRHTRQAFTIDERAIGNSGSSRGHDIFSRDSVVRLNQPVVEIQHPVYPPLLRIVDRRINKRPDANARHAVRNCQTR